MRARLGARNSTDVCTKAMKYDMTWYWRKKPEGQNRKGQHCRVVARGRMNSIMVEFEDGYRVITSRYAVRERHER